MKWINKVPLLVLTLQMLFALPASAQNGTWTTKASMPTARYSLGVGVINGKIYAIGGTTSVTSSFVEFE